MRILLAAIALGLLYILWREVRKIPAKLFALMATAFVDMVGLLMIIPLLPFYAKSLGGSGINVLGFHLGIGLIIGIIVAAFTVAQLLTPAGQVLGSRWATPDAVDCFRRFANCVPNLRVCLLLVLFLSRIVQGMTAAQSGDSGLRCRLD